jgi:hypothetical protein
MGRVRVAPELRKPSQARRSSAATGRRKAAVDRAIDLNAPPDRSEPSGVWLLARTSPSPTCASWSARPLDAVAVSRRRLHRLVITERADP